MIKTSKPRILVVVGPTASGKTDLAIKLAQDFNGEIVSADSRQFYRGMDIGTAKVSPDDQKKVPHHLIDIIDPNEPFSLFEFQKLAYVAIDDILKRGKLPILVGGTGLYVSAVIENYKLTDQPVDQKMRDELNQKDLNTIVVHLRELNPQTLVDLKNKRRVVRELERLLSDSNYTPGTIEPKYEVMIIQPAYDRDELYERINERVGGMIKHGLLGEIDNLVKKYGWEAEALKTAIGYSEFHGLDNIQEITPKKIQEILELIKQHSRNYAKRQITWFKRYNKRIVTNTNYQQIGISVFDFIKN